MEANAYCVAMYSKVSSNNRYYLPCKEANAYCVAMYSKVSSNNGYYLPCKEANVSSWLSTCKCKMKKLTAKLPLTHCMW